MRWTVELEVNLTALYTECDDQSSWYYMRTLFTIIQELVEKKILPQSEGEKLLNERIEAIKELLEVEPDCIYGDRFLNELTALQLYRVCCAKQSKTKNTRTSLPFYLPIGSLETRSFSSV